MAVSQQTLCQGDLVGRRAFRRGRSPAAM